MNTPLQFLLTFACGGAFGAVLKALFDVYRGRVQPVYYRLTCDSVFSSKPHAEILHANTSIEHNGRSYDFTDLALLKVEIANAGNADLPVFSYGITMLGGHKAVLVHCGGKDRHHRMNEGTATTPTSPADSVDFTCTPFNRGDEYSARIYVANNGELGTDQIKISTAQSLKLIRVTSLSEQTKRTVSSIVAFMWGAATGIAIAFGMVVWMVSSLASALDLPEYRLKMKEAEKAIQENAEAAEALERLGERIIRKQQRAVEMLERLNQAQKAHATEDEPTQP